MHVWRLKNSCDQEVPSKDGFATLQISLPCAQTGHKLEVRYKHWSETFEDDKPGKVFNWCAFYDDTERTESPLVSGARVVISVRIFDSRQTRKDTSSSKTESSETLQATPKPIKPTAAYLWSKDVDLVPPLVDWSNRAISEEEEAPHALLNSTATSDADDDNLRILGDSNAKEYVVDAYKADNFFPDVGPKIDAKLRETFGEEYEKHKRELEAHEGAKREERRLRKELEMQKSALSAEKKKKQSESQSGEKKGESLDNEGAEEEDEEDDKDRITLPSPLLWTLKFKPTDYDGKVLLSFGGDTFGDCALQLCDEDWGVISSLRQATRIVPNVSVNLVSIQIRKHFYALPDEQSSIHSSTSSSIHSSAADDLFDFPPSLPTHGQQMDNMSSLVWHSDPRNPTEIKARVIEAMHPGIILPTNETSMTFEPLQTEDEMLHMLQPTAEICIQGEDSFPAPLDNSESDSDSPGVSRYVDGGEFSPRKLAMESKRAQSKVQMVTKKVWRRTLLYTRLALLLFRFNPDHPKNREALEKRAERAEKGIGSGEVPDLISNDSAANHFVISERPYFATSTKEEYKRRRRRIDHMMENEKEDVSSVVDSIAEDVERRRLRRSSLDYDDMKVQFAKIDVSNDVVEREVFTPPPGALLEEEEDSSSAEAAIEADAITCRVPSVVITTDDPLTYEATHTKSKSLGAEPSSSGKRSVVSVEETSSSSTAQAPPIVHVAPRKDKKKKDKKEKEKEKDKEKEKVKELMKRKGKEAAKKEKKYTAAILKSKKPTL